MYNQEELEIIERKAEHIAGDCWTLHKKRSELPLSEQLNLIVQHAPARGPGQLSGTELEALAHLSLSAKEFESMSNDMRAVQEL